jgi:hypothetical protein
MFSQVLLLRNASLTIAILTAVISCGSGRKLEGERSAELFCLISSEIQADWITNWNCRFPVSVLAICAPTFVDQSRRADVIPIHITYQPMNH